METCFNDIVADEHPLIISTTEDLIPSEFIIGDLAEVEFRCMLSPQLELPSQDYADHPTSQLFSLSDDLQFMCGEGHKPKEETKPARRKQGPSTSTSTVNRRTRNHHQLVDLRTLLMQCAEAVGTNDLRNANDFLNQIRHHSSPLGNASQRKAYYFANAIEARLAGTGRELYQALVSNRSTPVCRSLASACPFIEVSNFFTIETIIELAKTATKIHIIHFGFPYGLQWTHLIQRLSTIRPGKVPPMLHVTGITIDEIGNFLANCCKQFNVPFEYNHVTKKLDSIKLEDLKIERSNGVIIIVNCLYRLRHVVDETADLSSPRDAVLEMVRGIRPHVFIHGIVNGSYNAPFFVSRFREALYYFSTMFDMVQEIVPCDDGERVALEESVYGKEILNVVACEGSERVERPETYKQWQVRNVRAGLRQLPLNRNTVKMAMAHVKLRYHRDFLVDRDKNWMVQGWKGRILFALSLWRPIKEV